MADGPNGGTWEEPRYEQDRPGAGMLWAAALGGNWGWPAPRVSDVHVHPGFELGLVLAGATEVGFGAEKVVCAQGDMWVCNSWEPHATLHSRDTCHVVFVFSSEFLGDSLAGDVPWPTLFAAPPRLRPIAVDRTTRARLLTLARMAGDEVTERPVYWEHMIRLYVMHFLTEIARSWGQQGLSLQKRVHAGETARIMPALSLVHSRPWRRVPVAEAARACGLSTAQFYRLFRYAMGLTFADFGSRARLAYVCHQLSNTDRPIAHLAIEAGFADGSHLCHHFERHLQCTPGEYRAATRRLREGHQSQRGGEPPREGGRPRAGRS